MVALAGTWALCEAVKLEDAFALEQSPTEVPFSNGGKVSKKWDGGGEWVES